MASEDSEESKVLKELAPKVSGHDDTEIVPKEPDIDAVQKRLEDLLSKHNLAEDAYIQQHMNAQMYIPLAVLARHHSLCVLGDEEALIAAAKTAAQRSDKFGIDEDGAMVRPLLKPRRNTLILRDLPDDFPEDELRALFHTSPESESFSSLKPDVNNTAFVSFKSDEAAQNVALWLRSQKFQGAEIKCAIKSEHFVRSFFPASAGPSMQASPYTSPQQAWGYPPWMQVPNAWGSSSQPEQFSDASMGWSDSSNWAVDAMPMATQNSMPRDAKGDGKGKSPKGKGKGRKRGALGGSFSQDSQMESSSDFASPQLPMMSQEPDGGMEGLAEPGYLHEYRKYSRQQIIEVCNAMEDIVKPESYERCESNDVALFRSSPCKDWAPLPTPLTTFASSFFGDDRRGSDATESEIQKSATEKVGRKAKGKSQPEGQDYEDAEWCTDSSWWMGGDSKRYGKSWSEGRSWDYKNSDAGYSQQQWIKKEGKEKVDEAEKDDSNGPRKMTWADKVKGGDPSERTQRWVAKTQTAEDGQAKEQDAHTQDSAAAACSTESDTAAPTAQAESAVAKPSNKEAAADASTSPSWADKVRQASSATK